MVDQKDRHWNPVDADRSAQRPRHPEEGLKELQETQNEGSPGGPTGKDAFPRRAPVVSKMLEAASPKVPKGGR